MAIPSWLLRYGALLQGGKTKPLWNEAMAQYLGAPGKGLQRYKTDTVRNAFDAWGHEATKVIGTYAGTGAAVAGAAAGTKNLLDGPDLGERFKAALNKSRTGRLMRGFGIKV